MPRQPRFRRRPGPWGCGPAPSIYARLQRPSDEPFDARVLRALHITAECAPADLLAVPSSGPLVVAANHPHGVLDGLLLASLVRSVRPDVRILANHLLARVPELAELCFYADPFGGESAGARSLAGLRAAQRWVSRGGALIVFPAGEVAHRRCTDGSYADSSWHSTTGRMVIATGARVVPAFIAGSNRRRFYAAGRVHPLPADGAAGARVPRQAGSARAGPDGTAALSAGLVEFRAGRRGSDLANSADGGTARRVNRTATVDLEPRLDVTPCHAPPTRSMLDPTAVPASSSEASSQVKDQERGTGGDDRRQPGEARRDRE